jgi:hypothetical protein
VFDVLIFTTPLTEAAMHFRPVTGLKKIERSATYAVKTEGYELRVPTPSKKNKYTERSYGAWIE